MVICALRECTNQDPGKFGRRACPLFIDGQKRIWKLYHIFEQIGTYYQMEPPLWHPSGIEDETGTDLQKSRLFGYNRRASLYFPLLSSTFFSSTFFFSPFEKPPYDVIRELVQNVVRRYNVDMNGPFDWQVHSGDELS